MKKLSKKIKRERRKRKIRKRISGTKFCPRLSVFRSAKHIYAQIINDQKSETLASASDLELKLKKKKLTKAQIAEKVGDLIAGKAAKLKIKKVVFDRAGFKYHGRLKALAEGARKSGLKF